MEMQEDLRESLDAHLARQHALLTQLENVASRVETKANLEQLKTLNEEIAALVDQLEE